MFDETFIVDELGEFQQLVYQFYTSVFESIV